MKANLRLQVAALLTLFVSNVSLAECFYVVDYEVVVGNKTDQGQIETAYEPKNLSAHDKVSILMAHKASVYPWSGKAEVTMWHYGQRCKKSVVHHHSSESSDSGVYPLGGNE